MKHKRLVILVFLMLFISIGVFIIYKSTYKEEFNYVALGDSLAAGRNPYGVDDYGYTDYIRDFLKKENKLNSYTSYAVSGYTTEDVTNDINYNKSVEVNDKNIGIKKALRESDLVTISIGANDFLGSMSISTIPSALSDATNVTKKINTTILNVEELLILIKQYAKGDIIVIGYYNPLPNLTKYKRKIDEVVSYADKQYEKICENQNVYYVKVSSIISTNNSYLPNPLDIHPNKAGYEAISKEVITKIKQEILN